MRLQFQCTIKGVGVDPDDPPVVWEAFDGNEWHQCLVGQDDTGGLNRDGTIILHVPRGHTAALIDGKRAGWLRVRVVEAAEDQPQYSSTPMIHGLVADTVGGTADAAHAELVENELLGVSARASAGRRFVAAFRPVLPATGGEVIVRTSSDAGWEEWTRVEHFAGSGPDDRHFMLDAVSGEVGLRADGARGRRRRAPVRRGPAGHRGDLDREVRHRRRRAGATSAPDRSAR